MLNEEFVNELFGNEEVTVEERVKRILAEHEADSNAKVLTATDGLVKKRDELLGEVTKLKDKNTSYEKSVGDKDSKIKELSDLLEKANAGDKKAEEYYNTKLAEMKAENEKAVKALTDDRDYYLSLHIQTLEDKAFEAGMKDLTFVPGLKEGFIARIKSMNDFEPRELEGTIKFVNRENKTVEDVIRTFAMTPEGKNYISNPSVGGGAKGSTGTIPNEKTMTREQLTDLQAKNPKAAAEFFAKGGKISS